jgi:hypothetical protein
MLLNMDHTQSSTQRRTTMAEKKKKGNSMFVVGLLEL